jgi:Predicted dienelactone hydrolase
MRNGLRWTRKLFLLGTLALSSLPAHGIEADTINSASASGTTRDTIVDASISSTSSIGFTLLSDSFKYRGGVIQSKIAVWYPSQTSPSAFDYKLGPSLVKTNCAVDGKLQSGSFPIIFYSHGATGAGTSSFFICEGLAKAGYIVAAPDFPDEVVAARIQQPIDFDTEMSLKTYRYIYWLRHYALNKAAKEGRDLYSTRPQQLRQTIQVLLNADRDSNSPFFEHIDETRLGLVGHSFGAWTSTLVAGADSEGALSNLKAIAALSGPVNSKVYSVLSKNDLRRVKVPILFEYGERETADGRGNDKKWLYDKANEPKVLFCIKDANHLSFSGGIKGEFKNAKDYLELDSARKTITETTVDFFDAFLKGDEAALNRLRKPDAGVSSFNRKI